MPRELSKCREWEKVRRERLKKEFTSLFKVLPCYEPSINLSQIEILQKAQSYIEELQTQIKGLLDGKDTKPEYNTIKKLHDRVKKLLIRNEQLCNLLTDAGIRLPSECGNVKKFRGTQKWSNKITSEQAKKLLKKEKEKENEEKKPKKKVQIKNRKVKSALLQKKVSRKSYTNNAQNITTNLLQSSNFITLVTTQSCFIITNAPSTNINQNCQAKTTTVLTNSNLFSTPLVASTVKPPLVITKTNGPINTVPSGTLLVANGNFLPVIQQPTLVPTQTIITNPTPIVVKTAPTSNTTLFVVPKSDAKEATVKTAPTSTSCVKTTVNSKATNVIKSLPFLKPKMKDLTKTTHINKVPIPALTSRYANELISQISTPQTPKSVKSKSCKSPRKVNAKGKSDKAPNKSEEQNLKDTDDTLKDDKNGKLENGKGENLEPAAKKAKLNSEGVVSENHDENKRINVISAYTIDSLCNDIANAASTATPRTVSGTSDISQEVQKDISKPCEVGDKHEKFEEENETSTIPPNAQEQISKDSKLQDVDPNPKSPTPVKTNDDSIQKDKEEIINDKSKSKEDQKNLELNNALIHSDLSNDIFASLSHVSAGGGQNPESTSPTAAFLLAFPLVSSLNSLKVAEVIEDEANESQHGTPTLLQIGTMDTTKTTQTQSDTLTPNLLNLDNFSFFSREFYPTFDPIVASSSSACPGLASIPSKNSDVKKCFTDCSTNVTEKKVSTSEAHPKEDLKYLSKTRSTKDSSSYLSDNKINFNQSTSSTTTCQSNIITTTSQNTSIVSNMSVTTNPQVVPQNTSMLPTCQSSAISQNVPSSSVCRNVSTAPFYSSSVPSQSTPLLPVCQGTSTTSCQSSTVTSHNTPLPSFCQTSIASSLGQVSSITPIFQSSNVISKNISPIAVCHSSSVAPFCRNSTVTNHNTPLFSFCQTSAVPSLCQNMTTTCHGTPVAPVFQSSNVVSQNTSSTCQSSSVAPFYQSSSKAPVCQASTLTTLYQSSSVTSFCQSLSTSLLDQTQPALCHTSYITSLGQNATIPTVGHSSCVTSFSHSNSTLPSLTHNACVTSIGHSSILPTPNHSSVGQNPIIPGLGHSACVTSVAQNSSMPPLNHNSTILPALGHGSGVTSIGQNSILPTLGHKSCITSIGQSSNVPSHNQNSTILSVGHGSGVTSIGKSSTLPTLGHNSSVTSIGQTSNLVTQNSVISICQAPPTTSACHNTPATFSNRNLNTFITSASLDYSLSYNHSFYSNAQTVTTSSTTTMTSAKHHVDKVKGPEKKMCNYYPATSSYSVPQYNTFNPFTDIPKSTTYPISTKAYNNALYSNNTTYGYSYHSDNFTSYPSTKTNIKPDKLYYGLNYDNYDYKPNDFQKCDGRNQQFANYYQSNVQNKEKPIVDTNKSSNVNVNTNNKVPVNWMTTPDVRQQHQNNFIVPSLGKDMDFGPNPIYSSNSFTAPQTTYFNANTGLYPSNDLHNTAPFPTIPPNTFQRSELEENQFSWSPSKLPQLLDTSHNFVSGTLPTLVGDLALGNTQPFSDQKVENKNMKEFRVKENARRSKTQINYDTQSNFLSVSQLVDHNKNEALPGRVANRRNSGNRSSNKAPASSKSTKRVSKSDKDVHNFNNNKVVEKQIKHTANQEQYQNQNSDNWIGSTNKGRNVKMPSNSYSAEALIGHQSQTDLNRNRNTQNYPMVNKSLPVPFLTDNIIPYFPMDIPQDSTLAQQNQNYQSNAFGHNFSSGIQGNVYTNSTFVPNPPPITTSYLPSTNFIPDIGTNTEYAPILPENTLTHVVNRGADKFVKNKPLPNEKTSDKRNLTQSNTNCSINPINTSKKSKKKQHNEPNLSNFDFSFLAMPAAINSPILPDDFHAHSNFLPPPTPTQLYPCKNPLYGKQDLTTNSLLPLPASARGGVAHPEVSPSLNNVGNTLTNFNLSAIFPEINKAPGPMADIYSDVGKTKDFNQREFLGSTSQVPFKANLSYINSPTSAS